MRSYVPTYFDVQEFVPPALYAECDVSSLLAMDPRILWTMDALREHYKSPITINDWHRGGKFTQRGLRTAADARTLSQHRFGRAVDFDIRDATAEQFRADARAGKIERELQFVTRIEDGVNWCHIDNAGVGGTEIVFFTKKVFT